MSPVELEGQITVDIDRTCYMVYTGKEWVEYRFSPDPARNKEIAQALMSMGYAMCDPPRPHD